VADYRATAGIDLDMDLADRDADDPLDSSKDPRSPPDTALTPRHRLKVARLVIDGGRPISEVTARFQLFRAGSGAAVARSRAGAAGPR
jgi:hypothetical protein